MANKKQVVVVGAGAAGLSVASRLRRAGQGLEVVLIDPAAVHYYQPLWTLVGAGIFPKERSRRPMADMIPMGVRWVQQAVTEFHPEESAVSTADGQRFAYDALVVCPGLQIDWGKIPGLKESVGKNGVCSNYSYDTVNSTWEQIQRFTGGRALFTIPSTPIKCAGAPLKVMFLAEDHFRRAGIRNVTKVGYMCAVAAIFRAPKYAERLSAIATARGIDVNYRQELTELRPDAKEAVFKHAESGEERVEKYDLIHVTPPMSAPDFIKRSALADGAGWVEVNKATMQHVRYSNVFSLGDASNLPTSKTAAAIRAQSPVLAENLLATLRGTTSDAKYYGYTSCPLVTGYGKLMLAEFDYDLKPCESFPFDQGEERGSMYLLKKYVLPEIYWRGLVRGRNWPWPLP